MRTISITGLLLAYAFVCCVACHAQALPAGAGTVARSDESHVSPVMGLNFSLDESGQHNSATGWADVVTPALSYRFNRHLSTDVSIPWYPTVKAFIPGGTVLKPTTTLETSHNLLGDVQTSGHFDAAPGSLSELATVTVGFATGNVRYGLGANTTTYNFTNHVDYSLGYFTPDIEVGEGNSSSLANRTARKSYVAVGPIANFQVGTTVDLPLRLELDLEAYENLPIGNQKVYGTVTRKGKNGKTRTVQVLQGTGAAEDNGFNTELTLPVGNHFVLSAGYQRSLIQALDTASLGVTWTLRAPKIR